MIIRVILGHHFAFGPGVLDVMNKNYVEDVKYRHTAGILFEAINQADYSVDTFLFIGATLLSYLLLKDLDKTDGWFSSRAGCVRMMLFYLNRYLRITIPYALTLAVYIGLLPLLLQDHMEAGHYAQREAHECKHSFVPQMLYLTIFPVGRSGCVGQTWYLSCDWLLFIVSPLIIYPLWRGRLGTRYRVMARVWWTVLLLGSVVGSSM